MRVLASRQHSSFTCEELKEAREAQEIRLDIENICSTDAYVAGIDKIRAATPARIGNAMPSVAQNSSGQSALQAASPRATMEFLFYQKKILR